MIGPDETEIRGAWIVRRGRVVADDNSRRIRQLIAASLQERGRDASGWDVLYVDPVDGRYWELLCLQSHLQGGGLPLLRHIGRDEARAKYVVE